MNLENAPNPDELKALQKFARFICERGLEAPAIFALELHKPLVSIAHAAAVGYSPVLRLLCGSALTDRLVSLLSTRDNIERCIVCIETESAGRAKS